METKKQQLDLLLKHNFLKQSGLPDYQILDFEQGITKQICPYQCSKCENIFKGLIEFVVHNRIVRTTSKCPSAVQLIQNSLRKNYFKANGHNYLGWIYLQPLEPTGKKDEILEDLEKKSFPNFNFSKG